MLVRIDVGRPKSGIADPARLRVQLRLDRDPPARDGHRQLGHVRGVRLSSQQRLAAGDVADPKTAERIVADAIARFGRIDTLVNNAGVFIAKPFVDYSPDDFAKLAAVNLGGFFYLTQRVAAHMLERGHPLRYRVDHDRAGGAAAVRHTLRARL